MIDWVKWDSYEVYAIPNLDPILGNRTQVVNPADKEASPNGWLDQSMALPLHSCCGPWKRRREKRRKSAESVLKNVGQHL